MAKASKGAELPDFDVNALSTDVAARFDDVPWKLFDSKDLASSGETRFMVSRIQADLLKVASVDPVRAGRIWDEHVPDFVPRPAELPEIEREDASVNAIEPGRRRRKFPAEPYLDSVSPPEKGGERNATAGPSAQDSPGKIRGGDRPALSVDRPVKDGREDERVRLLLEGLNKQYRKAAEKYHFRDKTGEVAFEAQEKKLVTQHDTPSVVQSMIDVAETRGWSALKLTGTQEFRREAWLQANLRDFEVSGYRPTKLDKVKLEELRTERQSPGHNTMAAQTLGPLSPAGPTFGQLSEDGWGEPKIPLTAGQDQAMRVMEATMCHRGDGPETIARARAVAVDRLTNERVHVGKLVEVGTAPYLDKPGEKPSHFVALEDGHGRMTKVWGIDLPRALKEAEVKLGQRVAVLLRGRQRVSVDVPMKDELGRTVKAESREVDRNRWEIVQIDKLRQTEQLTIFQAIARQENPTNLRAFDRPPGNAGVNRDHNTPVIRTREKTR